MEEYRSLKEEMEARLQNELKNEQRVSSTQKASSREYLQFKKDNLPNHMNFYEKLCTTFGGIIKFQLKPKQREEMVKNLEMSHLNITPEQAYVSSFLIPIIFGLPLAIIAFLFGSTFFALFFLIGTALTIKPLMSLPKYFANTWRMKASNQMILCVFYIVTYMRHTSNLELAIDFAGEHLTPPLSLDMKRIIWNVETQKFDSIKESLDSYLDTWKEYNKEFIEALHLIEGSLYEGSQDRRLALLDKSLDVILSETYEKMLHYAHNLKSPITMLHMLGVILPVLGLVILPLMVSFMESVSWLHISSIYNILIPISVFLMGKNILNTRPTGYGSTDLSTHSKFKHLTKMNVLGMKIDPMYFSLLLFIILFLVALSPIILHAFFAGDVILDIDGKIRIIDTFTSEEAKEYFLGYRMSSAIEGPNVGRILGPYGFGASLISMLFPLGIGLSIGLYYRFKSKNVIKIREENKRLENEFASALFQLGNRLGDGLPAEIAFPKVAEVMEGSVSGKFFEIVSNNVRKLGMGLEQAIFDKDKGAVAQYPSPIIESSMKVLIQAMKKGPKVAAEALMNISRYVKEIHKVDERLKDLMAEIISSMKSQIKFMAPVIAGIVIGITSMITNILGRLGGTLGKLQSGMSDTSGMSGVLGMFGDGIPTYFFQIVIGLYVVQIVAILTILSNGIENGSDKLNEKYLLGQNLVKSTSLYCFISFVIIFIFNYIAGQIMRSIV